MIETTKRSSGAQVPAEGAAVAVRGQSSVSSALSSQQPEPGDKMSTDASAALKRSPPSRRNSLAPGRFAPPGPDQSALGRARLPSSRDKLSSAPTAHAIVKMLKSIHWRPQSSGRATVEAWLQEVVAQSCRHKHDPTVVHRTVLHEALLAEDVTSAKHPSQKHPHNCVGNPYAFRIWPDKVQTLVAFDRVVAGPHVPRSLAEGAYAPVVLYQPRVTVVAITPTDDAEVNFKFAEAQPMIRANFDTLLKHLKLPRKRDAESYKAATIAGLKQLLDVCRSHTPYLKDVLLPSLRRPGPTHLLPTFGLCSSDVIEQALAQSPCAPNGVIAFLADYVAQEQQKISDYPKHIEMPSSPYEASGGYCQLQEFLPECHIRGSSLNRTDNHH